MDDAHNDNLFKSAVKTSDGGGGGRNFEPAQVAGRNTYGGVLALRGGGTTPAGPIGSLWPDGT